MSRHDSNPTREHKLPPLPVSTTLTTSVYYAIYYTQSKSNACVQFLSIYTWFIITYAKY